MYYHQSGERHQNGLFPDGFTPKSLPQVQDPLKDSTITLPSFPSCPLNSILSYISTSPSYSSLSTFTFPPPEVSEKFKSLSKS